MASQEFHVGDGATLHFMTDAHAYTVTAVSPGGKTITMQRDTATLDGDWKPDTRPGGFAGHTVNNDGQRGHWLCKANPDSPARKARLTRRGWTSLGRQVTGGRHEFRDYNF